MIDPRFFISHGPLSIDDIIKELPITVGSSFDSAVMIRGVSALPKSKAGDLTYLDGKAGLKTIGDAGATACLTQLKHQQAVIDAGMIPLVTDHPRAQFARILPRLYSEMRPERSEDLLHSSADIAPDAVLMPGVVVAQNVTIGNRTRIGVGTYIGPGVTIGDDCIIGAYVTIECAQIADGVTLGSNCAIGASGFGVANDGLQNIDILHLGRVLLGKSVSLGSHCAIDRGMLVDTRIGEGSKFDNFCHVAHNTVVGKNGLFAGFVGISGSCVIGDTVVMGGRVGLADHLSVGDGAMLAAGSGLMKNVPAGEVWSGYPAKPLRKHMKEVATLSRLAAPKKKT